MLDMNRKNRLCIHAVLLAALSIGFPVCAQEAWVKHGTFISQGDLPAEFVAALKKLGGRLTSADKATVSVLGTLTDGSGTRSVQLTLQAPGYLRFEDANSSRVIAYNGKQWQSKNGKGGQEDSRIQESLLAYFPDSFLLQLANDGSIRRIGGHFRTDDGTTKNYTGPYWTLYSFSPAVRQGLAKGQALQQGYFIALDEKTWLISEVRIVNKLSETAKKVVQTKFNNWFQQAGQWYPGEIIRLENGQQVLKLTVQQASTGAQLASATFEP